MPRTQWSINELRASTNVLTFKKLVPHAVIPSKSHETDAGYDLVASKNYAVAPGGQLMVDTGIAVALPSHTVGLVCPRSGLAAKHGITITNAPGVVDAGYRGELKVILLNTGSKSFSVDQGDRIAQLVVVPLVSNLPVVESDELPDADRGDAGFGSTGA